MGSRLTSILSMFGVAALCGSCLNADGETSAPVRPRPEGVRLIANTGGGETQAACDILRDCCEGVGECVDFVNQLSESACQSLLEGEASECLDNGGGGECCSPSDPCGWADDGMCDCPEQVWDFDDCRPPDPGEGEAEAEAEGEPDCCDVSDPCSWAEDGVCDCDEEFCPGACVYDTVDCQ